MKQQIQSAVKTSYLKYGLKAESTEKLVAIIEARLTAMGTIEPDKLQDAINEAIKLFEPSVALIQSEVESRIAKPRLPEPPTPPTPAPPTPTGDLPEWAKTVLQEVTDLKAKDALASKKAANALLLTDAAKLAKGKGAVNEKLLALASRLIAVDEGATTEQIADKLLLEYNNVSSAAPGEGAVPNMPSRQLSDAEVETARTAAVKKSAEAFQKKAENI